MNTSTTQMRWLTKKAARKGLALASWLSGSLDDLSNDSERPGIRVLTYHRFGDIARDPFCVTAEDFHTHIEYLATHELAISTDDLAAYLAGEKALHKNAVLVTIDDGFLSTNSIAMPILRDHAVPAVAFVSPDMVGKQAGHDAPLPESYASWSQIEDLQKNAIAIGSHSMTHRSMGDLSAEEIEFEARESREIIKARTGITARSFAYPFGTLADFNARTAEVLKRCGYEMAFTSQHGVVRAGSDSLELPRLKVEGGENATFFKLIARGGLDAWRFVDRTLWRLQARSNAW